MGEATCPFSADRLNELHWIERKSLAEIALIAIEADIPTTPRDVEAWLTSAGIAVWRGASPPRIATQAESARSPVPILAGQIVRKCEICGLDLPLAAFVAGQNSCRNCAAVATAPKKGPHRGAMGVRKEPVAGRYECYMCHNWFAPAEMIKPDSPTKSPKICKACQGKRNREYYLANREARIKASQDNKAARAKRG